MKKNIIIVCFVMLSSSLMSQILTLEQLKEVKPEDRVTFYDQINGIRHIKDVNGVLNKYVGTWKGSFDGKQLEIVFKKYTRDISEYIKEYHPEPLLWDQLIAKYKLTDQNGVVLVNTLGLSDDSSNVLYKYLFYDLNTYSLRYHGVNSECGDNGYIYLFYQGSATIHLVYSFVGSVSPDCTTVAVPSLPLTTLVLTKQ